jgi:V/A-type H+/Na+-transporting ATPase subunit K
MDFSMVGPGILLALGCIGSSIGCSIAGMACHGVMTHVDEGHGKLIGLAALPASQSIYSFVLMILMKGRIVEGALSPLTALGIGVSIGLAELFCSVFQGKCIVTAVQATGKQPALFGKCAAAPGIVETFSIFAFVFAILII